MKNYHLLTDAALVEKFNGGDATAFREIYTRYWKFTYNHCRRMLGDDDLLACDQVQEIFITFHSQGGSLNPQKPLPGYFFICAKFKVLNLIRAEQTRDAHLESFASFVHSEYPADAQLLEKELQELIRTEVDRMPEKMRVTFLLSRSDYSQKEIAAITGTTVGTVKKQLYLALKTMRSKLTLFIFL